jgi:pimeloyl-ACP methyl ester carboxylesterase
MRFFGDDSQPSDPDVVTRAIRELATIDLGPDLRRISAPTTVVYAVPAARFRASTDHRFAGAYRGLPAVWLVRIDNSGHMIMFDQPARFRSELAAFLRR